MFFNKSWFCFQHQCSCTHRKTRLSLSGVMSQQHTTNIKLSANLWSSCQKLKMMQCALVCCYLWKQNISSWFCILCQHCNLTSRRTELSKLFQEECFHFAQMKSFVKLCIYT